MGSNEDIMHEFVRRELKRLYPTVDGWQIKPVSRAEGEEQAFIVTRRILGRSEGANVVVSFEQKVDPGIVDQLKSGKISGVSNPGRVLVVPRGADTSEIAEDVRTLEMQSFGFDGDELVWLKRRAQVSEKTLAKESA
ncbi:MAG: hypothetical protein APR55_11520 [Methanolinea sp. SDB]|nr:MAG: hypothetical protein APR55_11520 [Methanolinea sp. SDB]